MVIKTVILLLCFSAGFRNGYLGKIRNPDCLTLSQCRRIKSGIFIQHHFLADSIYPANGEKGLSFLHRMNVIVFPLKRGPLIRPDHLGRLKLA
jgi:hypothetical protein